jgi:hypothetical protein
MKLPQRAILAPLLGLGCGWILFMFASWSDLFVQPVYDAAGNFLSDGPSVRLSTYLYLLGIALFAFGAFLGLRLSSKHRAGGTTDSALALAAYRFGNLSVIIALAAGAVFAIGNFLNAFGGRNTESLGERIIGVYLPIVLATALVVVLLLFSFVYRSFSPESSEADQKKATIRQKALGWGYALPILAAAIAIILGLIVYDVTGTSLETWVWVIIQVLIASGIILGTRFARRAKAEKPPAPKPRTAGASGAWNLNFVLSIVFGGVVSVMAFVFGIGAFEQLRDYNFDYAGWEIEPVTFSWVVGDFAPALVLIALVIIGLYATITERHRVEG